jgi:hypothetical protein
LGDIGPDNDSDESAEHYRFAPIAPPGAPDIAERRVQPNRRGVIVNTLDLVQQTHRRFVGVDIEETCVFAQKRQQIKLIGD